MNTNYPSTEREFVKYLAQKFSLKHPQIHLPLGDDAASFISSPDKTTLITVDTLVEGTHFLDISEDYYLIGRKSLLVNISDIAAMGGRPRYFLLSLTIPPNFDFKKLDDLLNGLSHEAENNQLVLLGGDSVGGKVLTISITLLGEAWPGKIITRSGAKAGEGLFLSGRVGEAAGGLKFLNQPRNQLSKSQQALIERHYLPPNRVELAQTLVDNFNLSSMLDLSDGLYEGVKELSLQSGGGFLLDWSAITISADLLENFSAAEIEDLCLYGGEDYELLFTAPLAEAELIIERTAQEHNIIINLIGEVKPPDAGLRLKKNQEIKELSAGRLFEHFHF